MVDTTAIRWGRLVEHDPASRSYAVPDHDDLPIGDVVWARFTPILDQGSLGSCTGNAMAGWLGSRPHSSTAGQAAVFNEEYAIGLYSMATTLDSFPGTYPPEDPGSSGLAVAKAARRRGLITSYRWAFTTRGLLHALQHGPVLLGVPWHEGMMTTDRYGVVCPVGPIVGGHEVLCRGVRDGNLICDNSWGPDWGHLGGMFLLPLTAWEQLRSEQADVVAPDLPHPA